MDGFARRPITHTCGPLLELPRTYILYSELAPPDRSFRVYELKHLLILEGNWPFHQKELGKKTFQQLYCFWLSFAAV